MPLDDETVRSLVRILRIHQERQLQLRAEVNALRIFVGRLSHIPEDAHHWLEESIAQFRASEEDIEERQQVDALLDLFDRKKNPNEPDA